MHSVLDEYEATTALKDQEASRSSNTTLWMQHSYFSIRSIPWIVQSLKLTIYTIILYGTGIVMIRVNSPTQISMNTGIRLL